MLPVLSVNQLFELAFFLAFDVKIHFTGSSAADKLCHMCVYTVHMNKWMWKSGSSNSIEVPVAANSCWSEINSRCWTHSNHMIQLHCCFYICTYKHALNSFGKKREKESGKENHILMFAARFNFFFSNFYFFILMWSAHLLCCGMFLNYCLKPSRSFQSCVPNLQSVPASNTPSALIFTAWLFPPFLDLRLTRSDLTQTNGHITQGPELSLQTNHNLLTVSPSSRKRVTLKERLFQIKEL